MKLLNLPILSFENIYQHLDPIDVVNLASLSHRMELLILSVKSYHKQGIECDIEIKKTRRVITLRKEGEKEFTWSSHSRRDYWAADATDLVDKKFGGRMWRVSSHESGYRMIGINDDVTLFWLQHLRALISCQIVNVIYEKDNDSRAFDHFFVKSEALQVAGNIKIHSLSLSNQQITYLLDNVKAKNLELCMERTSFYDYRECAYQFDSILIRNSFSITLGDVWVMGQSCASVRVDWMNCNYSQLNELIRNWLSSDNQKLEYCTMQTSWAQNCIESLLQGIPASRGCPKRSDASRFYDNSVRYEYGRDIRRKDGRIATVLITSGNFIFIVWQMANPNL